MIKGIINFFNLLHIAMVYIAKFLMVAMVLIIFVNVVLRYVFNSGIMWSEEVALLLAVWFIFIAMSLGVKQDLHININLLSEQSMPKVINRIFTIIKSLIIGIIGLTMLIHGWKLVEITMKSIMPATRWPAGLLYIILPISAIVMIYESIMDLLNVDTKDVPVDRFLSGSGSYKDVIKDGNHA